jgi:hypothetical protein
MRNIPGFSRATFTGLAALFATIITSIITTIVATLLTAMLALPALADDTATADSASTVNSAGNTAEPTLASSSTKLLKSYVLGRNVQIGLGYAQENMVFTRPGDRAQMTDNGSIVLLASLSSQTRPLRSWALRDGGAVSLGYDFTATGSFFDMNQQLVQSADAGSKIGTDVKGGFIAAAPRLTLNMGPLYADSHVFWKYSLGVGPALLHYSGNAAFYGDNASGTHAVSGSAVPAVYFENRWTTQLGHWDLVLNAQYVASRHEGYNLAYQVYGFGVAYEFGF